MNGRASACAAADRGRLPGRPLRLGPGAYRPAARTGSGVRGRGALRPRRTRPGPLRGPFPRPWPRSAGSPAALCGIPLGLFRPGGHGQPVQLDQAACAPCPVSALPLALIWFGIGFRTTVFLVALAAFFPILRTPSPGPFRPDLLPGRCWRLGCAGCSPSSCPPGHAQPAHRPAPGHGHLLGPTWCWAN